EENLEAPVQIASTQTLLRRKNWKDLNIDLFVYDEAHITSFSGSADLIREQFPEAYWLGLTATPWRLKKKEGMGDKFQKMIAAPLIRELISMEFLCKPIYYGIPEVDLTGVGTVDGDYNEADLALKCDRTELINEAVNEWHRLAPGRKTIAFAVNVKHAEHIAAAFCDRGVPFVCVTADTPIHARKRHYRDLEDGVIAGIVSVGCLTEGFDIRSIDCILLCRPTKSKAIYFQSIGRGLRIFPGKKNCIIIDQSGNVRRHGFVESLTKGGIQLKIGKDKGPGEALMKVCGYKGEDVNLNKGCEIFLYNFVMKCPQCGYLFPPKESVSHLGQLKLLMPDNELEKYQFYQNLRKQTFKAKLPMDSAITKYHGKYNKYPDEDWSFAAIFGTEPSLKNALDLKKYCDELDCNILMEEEFGYDWRDRLDALRKHIKK
ncbi:MAG: DEAD/DEAH box helicase, partial [Microcoleus sp.]